MTESLAAPKHLSRRAKALWKLIVPDRVESAERRALLTVALECLDRSDGARTELKTSELTTTTATTKAVHLHPLLKVERESKAQFLKAWSMLGLNVDPIEDDPDDDEETLPCEITGGATDLEPAELERFEM